jgi:hypothetical protein
MKRFTCYKIYKGFPSPNLGKNTRVPLPSLFFFIFEFYLPDLQKTMGVINISILFSAVQMSALALDRSLFRQC